MKTIVCFGDSNTWGADPAGASRHPREKRWPSVMARELGGEYEVIAEGQRGRTTVWLDPIEGPKRGSDYLLPCLDSHAPADLLIIFLGTNDLKHRNGLSAWDIAHGAGTLVQMAQGCAFGPGGSAPRVLLLAPPPVAGLNNRFRKMFDGGVEVSRELGIEYRAVAEELGCDFLDLQTVVRSSDLDGIHLEASEHEKLGVAVAAKVRAIL